ncbi:MULTISPECIES: SOS response-associated peptidase [unclassified Rathayibacter]|uniref:SOS response-associated peptidase n=1 Tax=unclassified Rathayibacter TaxID=2609250 RepID=UPI00188BBF91|nr:MULTISPECIES: SOS response-associated peptidase [unclassified Rathayibacter]MBF4462027.1 SOS response-associated peptidase [Rathayibacter sp. VKM Ac-2879]MBF4503930.1 SOS response-associated peptidase [Rathayibacter sp. VKM Ac-2878]
MCGRFALSQTSAELVALFDIDEPEADLPGPSWNVAPTQRIPIVAESMKGVDPGDPPRRRLAAARWGLVPRAASDPSAGRPLINARLESVAEKPSFREAFAARRAIVPASGWYEWRVSATGAKRPVFMSPPAGGLVLFAGLYEWWRSSAAGSPWLLSATILTRPAAGAVAEVHERMPVLLPPELMEDWLDPSTEGDGGLLRAVSDGTAELAEELEVHVVSDAVNSVAVNGPELIRPVDG